MAGLVRLGDISIRVRSAVEYGEAIRALRSARAEEARPAFGAAVSRLVEVSATLLNLFASHHERPIRSLRDGMLASRRSLGRRTIKQVESLNGAYSFLRHYTDAQSTELVRIVAEDLHIAREHSRLVGSMARSAQRVRVAGRHGRHRRRTSGSSRGSERAASSVRAVCGC